MPLSRPSQVPDVSVVVPIFNERENLPELRRRLAAALDSTGKSWEWVAVNDGSRDGSDAILRTYHSEDTRIKLVSLSRNFGHQPAVTAGIHAATGKCVILIDGDLQDPPEVIPQMVEMWSTGFDVVLGERTARAEQGARGIGFRLFYPILRAVTDLPSAPDAGIFGLMDRRVVEEFNRFPERNRFIPGLRSWLGFKTGSVLYERQERAAGQPKQTLRKLLKYAIDGMLSFSYKPLKAVTAVGLLVAAFGFATAAVFIVRRLAGHDPAVTGFTTLLSMTMFLGGIQLVCLGILGEYVGRIYEEVKQRPLYVIGERVGFGDRTIVPREPDGPIVLD